MIVPDSVADMPLAELEGQQLDLRTISALESCCGLYVRDVLMRKREWLLGQPDMGPARLGQFMAALRKACGEAI